MKQIFALFALLSMASCHKKDEVAYYFNKEQQDTLTTNIMTFVAENPPFANDTTRFQAKYNNYYWMRLPSYKLVKLEMKEDSTWYYFLTRPVANILVFQRGVIGTFKLKKGSLKPYDFKEVVNTPHLKEAEVLERGAFLFREFKNKGKLDEYMVMKDYIQWPDSTLQYNETINRWVPTHKL